MQYVSLEILMPTAVELLVRIQLLCRLSEPAVIAQMILAISEQTSDRN
jgi:hypothetical protein